MEADILKDRGLLFLGSRLKRLAERMQGDVVKLAEAAGLSVQPGQYPLLAILDRNGPQTVGALAETLEMSQPSVTRAAARLCEMGLIRTNREARDQRVRTLSLTQAGDDAIARSKARLWPQVEAVVAELTEGLEGPLLDQVAELEARLKAKSLDARARDLPQAGLAIREFSDDLAPAFRDINAQWIGAMYRLEATDIEVLENPRARIIDPGGAILFVEAPGLGVVGACALQKTGEGRFELTKMGVLESARGRKVGEALLEAVIAKAQAMGAQVLYLLSNRKSEAAIHLYEKLGFVHDPGIMAEYGARYARCDVAMRYAGPRAS